MSIPADATIGNDKIAIYRSADTPRFNVKSKSLENTLDRITVRFDRNEERQERVFLNIAGTTATYEDQMKSMAITRLILLQGTAIQEDHSWAYLPRITDYYPQEEFYDVDEMDSLYLQAAQKRGW